MAWCPKCGDRFRWHVRCPDCGVELVEQRPGPVPAPTAKLVRVFVDEDGSLMGVAKSLLQSESIEYLERGEQLQNLFGCGRFGTGYSYIVGPSELWVCADNVDRARALLDGLGTPASEDTAPPDDRDDQGSETK